MPIGAAAILGGTSLLGGLFSSDASSKASKQTADAARYAADISSKQYDQTSRNVLPWLQSGTTANQVLSSNYLGIDGPTGAYDPTAPLLQDPRDKLGPAPVYNMPQYTADMYHASPGYNFALQGGSEALANAGATTSGAFGGNTLKALQGYGTGLANKDYYQAYDKYAADYLAQFTGNNKDYWSNYDASNQHNTNLYTWLNGLSTTGVNAGLGVGSQGVTAAGNTGNALISAGAATGAGTLGSANAISGGVSSAANYLTAPNSASNNSILSSLLYGGGSAANTGYVGSYFGGSSEVPVY